MHERQITKASSFASHELKQLIQSVFALELARPGDYLWLASPWLSDVGMIDNTLGSFQYLHPEWPNDRWSLCDILVEWLRRSKGYLHLVTRPIPETSFFRNRMDELLQSEKNEVRERYILYPRDILHQKVFLGQRFMIQGSMNWTYSGLEVWDEHVSLITEPQLVHEKHLDLCGTYGVSS